MLAAVMVYNAGVAWYIEEEMLVHRGRDDGQGPHEPVVSGAGRHDLSPHERRGPDDLSGVRHRARGQ